MDCYFKRVEVPEGYAGDNVSVYFRRCAQQWLYSMLLCVTWKSGNETLPALFYVEGSKTPTGYTACLMSHRE